MLVRAARAVLVVQISESADAAELELNRLVEDLLLNIDRKETITCAEPEVKSSSIISIGAKASTIPFSKYLGQPIPNYALRRDDGSTVKLYDLLGSKVTMLVVTITPENKGMMGHYNGVAMTLQTARSVYDNFALGEAGAGRLKVPNAYPDVQ